MAMMRMIKNMGRKGRTAYMKTSRPKTVAPKPMSDEWRSRQAAGDPAAKTELKKHHRDAYQAMENRMNAKSSSRPAEKKKPQRVTFKGQDMTEKNFKKSFHMSGSYKYGTIVSKEAVRTGGKKAVSDSYGSKGFKNYKTRSYQP